MSLFDVVVAKKFIGGGSEWDRNFTIGEVPPLPPSSSGGIIEVDVLPTENIDTEAFYYLKPSVDNTIKGTWVFNDEIDHTTFPSAENGLPMTFTAGDGVTYTTINFTLMSEVYRLTYSHSSGMADAYRTGELWGMPAGWQDDAYKTIEILEEPTDETFITWLRANATKHGAVVDNSGYYKWVEGGGTWVLNDELTPAPGLNCDIAFTFENENGETYTGTNISQGYAYADKGAHIKFTTDIIESWGSARSFAVYCFDTVYNGTIGWKDTTYKTISFLQTVTDATLLTWLNENGTASSGWKKFSNVGGTIIIKENGIHNVSSYETANVRVDIPTSIIISVGALPTENINLESIYLYNGNYYKYDPVVSGWIRYYDDGILAVDTLPAKPEENALYLYEGEYYKYIPGGGTTWRLNDTVTYGYFSSNTPFVSNGEEFYGMHTYGGVYYGSNFSVYSTDTGWIDEAYRTLTFTTKLTRVEDGSMLSWLEANGTLVSDSPAWVKYNSSIEVDELPADDIDINSFYVCDEEYYKHTIEETWVLNDTIVFNTSAYNNVEFKSNGEIFVGFNNYTNLAAQRKYDGTYVVFYSDEGVWLDDAYKTWTFLQPVTDSDLLNWLTQNGTKQTVKSTWYKYVPVEIDNAEI